MISRRPERLGRSKWMERSKRPGRSSAGSRSSARLVAPMMRTLAGVERRFDSWRPSGSQLLSRSTTKPCSRSARVGWSKLCSWISSSLTMPATPSRPWERDTVGAARAAAPSAGVIRIPAREAAMASISSMKPTAPPSARAALRSSLKYERIFRFVCP